MYFCDDQGSYQRRQNIDGQKEQPRLCTTTLHFYVLEFFRLVVFLYREQKKKANFGRGGLISMQSMRTIYISACRIRKTFFVKADCDVFFYFSNFQ